MFSAFDNDNLVWSRVALGGWHLLGRGLATEQDSMWDETRWDGDERIPRFKPLSRGEVLERIAMRVWCCKVSVWRSFPRMIGFDVQWGFYLCEA